MIQYKHRLLERPENSANCFKEDYQARHQCSLKSMDYNVLCQCVIVSPHSPESDQGVCVFHVVIKITLI